MGWRYLLFTLGGCTLLLWGLRFFIFTLEESPRFLAGRGQDTEAVAVVQRLAAYNGRTSTLTVEQLTKAAEAARERHGLQNGEKSKGKILSQSSAYTMDHVKALFETRKLAWSTSLLIALWGIIGLASTLYNNFLPYLLASRGAKFGDSTYYITYRNVCILFFASRTCLPYTNRSTASHLECPRHPGGVSGRLGSRAADSRSPGHTGDLRGQVFYLYAWLTLLNDLSRNEGLTGVFLFASTTARNSDALLGWNCG